MEILCGDCLEIMRSMETDSVDLVLCSPPYEAARTYGIDFKLTGQDWVDWAKTRYLECLRISRGLVAWNVEGQTRRFRYSAAPILLAADLHRANVHLRKPPIFHRVGIPGSGGPDWLRNDYEFVICATSGGKLPWSDNVAMGHSPKWAPGGEMSHRLSDGTKRNQWGGGREAVIIASKMVIVNRLAGQATKFESNAQNSMVIVAALGKPIPTTTNGNTSRQPKPTPET